MALTRSQKRYLVGVCHQLHPVVMVGQKGLSDEVLAEIDGALGAHELVKVKLRGEREERRAWAQRISEHLGAELVQQVGMTASFFRRDPDAPQLELPR